MGNQVISLLGARCCCWHRFGHSLGWLVLEPILSYFYVIYFNQKVQTSSWDQYYSSFKKEIRLNHVELTLNFNKITFWLSHFLLWLSNIFLTLWFIKSYEFYLSVFILFFNHICTSWIDFFVTTSSNHIYSRLAWKNHYFSRKLLAE